MVLGSSAVAFDRVAQVTSILVLGPVDAAWVNGLASLIYPWQRLRLGVSLRLVVTASLHNAGLMMFVILGSGLLYEYLGGAIPVTTLDLGAGLLLFCDRLACSNSHLAAKPPLGGMPIRDTPARPKENSDKGR